MSAPDPTGERQEHLDAVISFAGAGQKRRMFRVLDILRVKWATWDLPEECRFLLNTQLMFFEEPRGAQVLTLQVGNVKGKIVCFGVPFVTSPSQSYPSARIKPRAAQFAPNYTRSMYKTQSP